MERPLGGRIRGRQKERTSCPAKENQKSVNKARKEGSLRKHATGTQNPPLPGPLKKKNRTLNFVLPPLGETKKAKKEKQLQRRHEFKTTGGNRVLASRGQQNHWSNWTLASLKKKKKDV